MDRQPLDHDQVTRRKHQLDIAGLTYDITVLAQEHHDPNEYAKWLYWQGLYTVSLPFLTTLHCFVLSLLPAIISLLHRKVYSVRDPNHYMI
jgi:hypothetical protein